MGTTCCYLIESCCVKIIESQESSSFLETSDWIEIISLAVNSFLAFWIIKTLQDKLTNKRVLKDHFISEIKELRDEYRNCITNLLANNTNPKEILSSLKLMNIKVNDLIIPINQRYRIEKEILHPYQHKLRELITENVDFQRDYSTSETINFSSDSKNMIIKFQQAHNHLFNDIIIKINDSK